MCQPCLKAKAFISVLNSHTQEGENKSLCSLNAVNANGDDAQFWTVPPFFALRSVLYTKNVGSCRVRNERRLWERTSNPSYFHNFAHLTQIVGLAHSPPNSNVKKVRRDAVSDAVRHFHKCIEPLRPLSEFKSWS